MSVLYLLALVDALLIQIKVIEELLSDLHHLLASWSLGTDLIMSLFTHPYAILNLCDFLSWVQWTPSGPQGIARSVGKFRIY